MNKTNQHDDRIVVDNKTVTSELKGSQKETFKLLKAKRAEANRELARERGISRELGVELKSLKETVVDQKERVSLYIRIAKSAKRDVDHFKYATQGRAKLVALVERGLSLEYILDTYRRVRCGDYVSLVGGPEAWDLKSEDLHLLRTVSRGDMELEDIPLIDWKARGWI